MKNYIYLLILCILNSCIGQPAQYSIQVKEIAFLEKTDIISVNDSFTIYLVRRFLINFNSKDSAIDSLLDIYVNKAYESKNNLYDQYDLVFYKESSKTNEVNLKQNPRDLDRYSQENDLIYSYTRYKEENKIYKRKYQNGLIVLPKSQTTVIDVN